MNPQTTIVAVAGNKGGITKTTTTVNLAHGLALLGNRVLVADGDRQGNASDGLGMAGPDMLFDALDAVVDADGVRSRHDQKQSILPTKIPYLDLIRGGPRSQMLGDMHKTTRVDLPAAADLLARAGQGYDFMIIDTPPSGYMQELAIAASDIIIAPTILSAFDVKGMEEIVLLMKAIKENIGQPPAETIVLPVMVDMREREAREQGEWLKAHKTYSEMLTDPIPKAAVIKTAQGYGETIHQFEPSSKAASAYRYLADCVIERSGQMAVHVLEPA